MNKFDVFLSFKNSDSMGRPSKEQKMASQLYAALTGAGISTFYSNETLSLLGTAQYKAAIDDALDDVRILIAIGTSRENLNSSWVRYEWDGFYSDILSGKKEGQLFSYIDEMDTAELPRTLRQLQCFEADKCSINDICQYVENALEQSRVSTVNLPVSGHHNKQKSTYSFLQEKESVRLTSQADLVYANDIELLTPVIDALSATRKLNILDVGCANGYLTKRVFEKYEDKIQHVVGIDKEITCINIASQEYSNPYIFGQVDLENDAFEEHLSRIMHENDIDSFDLVFCALVLHHLTDPQKLLRRLRRFIKKGGQVYLRSCDDGEMMGYPDNDELIEKTLKGMYDLPGISDRIHGRKLYSEVHKAGYTDIRVKSYYITTAGMTTDERDQFFFDMFYWRKNRYKLLIEKNPSDESILRQYNEYCANYDEIEDRFFDPEFYFRVAGPIIIATK